MSKLNVRSSFSSDRVTDILEHYGIDGKKYDERVNEESSRMRLTSILEDLIEESFISSVMVSVLLVDGVYHITVANEPKKMSNQIEHRMRVRIEMAKSYVKFPADCVWGVLTQHILQNELCVPQILMDLSELCAFDEDTDEETLRATLGDVRERLQKIVDKLNEGEAL